MFILNFLRKIASIPSPIPLPVFVLAVLVAFLVLAPTVFILSRLENKLDTINTEVYLLRSFQEQVEASPSASPSVSPSPSPTVKPKPVVTSPVGTSAGEVK